MNTTINIWAVLAATLAHFIIGGLWYSPVLFVKPWMRAMGISQKEFEKKAKKNSPAKAMTISFFTGLLMSYVLAYLIDYAQASTIAQGLQIGAWLWLGFVATSTLSPTLFEGRNTKLWLINVSYELVALLVMGAILAVWV